MRLATSDDDGSVTDTSSWRVAAYFKGDALDPDVITRLLGVMPTDTQRTGERWRTSSDREAVARTGVWELVHRVSDDASETLLMLAGTLARSGVDLSALPDVEEAYFDVFIAELADNEGGGAAAFFLRPACIRALAPLGLEVRFTVDIVRE